MSFIFRPFSSEFLPDEEYIYFRKLRDRQSKAVTQAFVSFRTSLVENQENYNLYDVKGALIERGVPDSGLNHHRNNIIDRLDVYYRNINFELSIPLFPKRNYAPACTVKVKSCNITEYIELTYTPESVAELILSVIEWLQEYDKIEIQLKQELKQEEIAKEISIDLLKRAAGDILDRKGYEYDVFTDRSSNIASLRIGFEGEFTMTFEVNLMENFIDKLTKVIESLPDNQKNN